MTFVTQPQCNDTVNTHSQSDSKRIFNTSSTLERQVLIVERLRQASLSFNMTLVVASTSALICFTSVGLLLSGNISVGKVTTAAGLASNVVSLVSLKFAKDANDRLDQMID